MPPLFLQVSSKGTQAVHIIVPLLLESVQDMKYSRDAGVGEGGQIMPTTLPLPPPLIFERCVVSEVHNLMGWI